MLPSIIAPKGYRGRRDFFDGFRKYYDVRGYQNASRMVQARYQVNRKYSISDEDIAHFEISVCVALLVNSTLAAFWALYYVYSQSSLLEELRSLMSPYIQASRDPAKSSTRHVNVANIASGCPLLGSIIQETLRVQSTNAFGTGRAVLEDTLIEDQYLFKQGSMVMIPSAELHGNTTIWGPTAREFDARRFCSKGANASKKRVSEFRTFGGGASFCAGNILAERQISIILVMMILRFDLEPANGGSWSLPPSQPHTLGTIMIPTTKFCVKINEREGYESKDWTFEWNERSTLSNL